MSIKSEPEPLEQLHRRFSALDDPRVERTKWHNLLEMITIAICAVVCGADDRVEMAEFGNEKLEFFKQF